MRDGNEPCVRIKRHPQNACIRVGVFLFSYRAKPATSGMAMPFWEQAHACGKNCIFPVDNPTGLVVEWTVHYCGVVCEFDCGLIEKTVIDS